MLGSGLKFIIWIVLEIECGATDAKARLVEPLMIILILCMHGLFFLFLAGWSSICEGAHELNQATLEERDFYYKICLDSNLNLQPQLTVQSATKEARCHESKPKWL